MNSKLSPTMSALRYHEPGKVVIEEVSLPRLDEGDLLVEVAACGVCATDVKTFVRGHPKIKRGAILGHEISGIVANSVAGFEPGDRVAIAPYCPCGECRYCLRDQPTLCETLFSQAIEPGGFTEFIRVPAQYISDLVVSVPDHLTLDVASLAEPLACCVHALERSGLRSGDSILVIGDGPMGLMQAEVAKALGAATVVVSGMTPHRLSHASEFADTIDARVEELEPAARRLLPDGADVVVVSVPSAEIVTTAIALTRRGGVVELFAGMPPDSQVTVPAAPVHYEGIRIQGTFGFSPAHFRTAVKWLAEGKINGPRLVTGRVEISEVADALARASRHEGIKTVMVRDIE